MGNGKPANVCLSYNHLCMLTTRGFYFFVPVIALMALAVLLGAFQLLLICATLLVWFLIQWFFFQLRVRLVVRRLRLERVLRTARGEVRSVWARQPISVHVELASAGPMLLPYVVATERLPALARLNKGKLRIDGPLGKDAPLAFDYAVECPGRVGCASRGSRSKSPTCRGFSPMRPSCAMAGLIGCCRPWRSNRARRLSSSSTTPCRFWARIAMPGPADRASCSICATTSSAIPPRMIAWKVSARRDRLITKEFESEVPIRCTLVSRLVPNRCASVRSAKPRCVGSSKSPPPSPRPTPPSAI